MEIEFVNVTYKENIRTPLEVTYLNNVNLKFEVSLIYTVIGSSESGISKLPLLINGVGKPTMGYVKTLGFINNGKYIRNINKLRMNIGYLPSNPNDFLISKTVKDELSFGLKYFKYKLNKKSIRINEALKLVNLSEEYLNKRISELSMSEKKKVALASTLIFNPSVIILDEPWLFLNKKDRTNLNNLILKLKNSYKKTIIILTKDCDEAYEVADKVMLFDKGSLVKEGDKCVLEDIDGLAKINVDAPDIVKFINESNNMGANLTYTSNILDLIKEVYRNAK